MTGSIRNFEKLNFTPKSSVFCFSQGQTSKYDRLAQQTPGSRFSRAFFDVKAFSSIAKTLRRLLEDAYKYHETIKSQNINKKRMLSRIASVY